ncbi:MAG: DMT family transporter [Thiohalobacterales bacterium]|nr:DMT family transporter [Thiohalobacterales bacterium]
MRPAADHPGMPGTRLFLMTAAAMLAFAGNSLLCRMALATTQIDPASFTLVRIVAGAVTLYVLVQVRRGTAPVGGNWMSALALFGYAAGFSFAYVSLSAGTGALLLFGAVQATMIGYGLFQGERLGAWQVMGVCLAVAGLIGLLLPGVQAPPLGGSLLMLGAGVAWGIYSLRGRGISQPTEETAGNFIRAVPMAIVVSGLWLSHAELDTAGIWYAAASGAMASGLGYAIWYSVLPRLAATTAATVQLSVPAIAAITGVILLSEPITVRLLLASAAILGGIAVFILVRPGSAPAD